MTQPNCIVCYDGFNKSTRAETKCPYCNTSICRTCLQTYVLNSIDDVVRCVNPTCGNGWTREFLDNAFTRTFRLSTFKEHREKILADREKARLPTTQEDAAAYKNAVAQINTISPQEADILREMARLQNELNIIQTTKHRMRIVAESFGRTRLEALTGTARVERAAPAAFIKPCPADGCRGFLSTAWKCGLCELWTCPECHDLKGPERDAEHTCDPTKVETARLLAREAKNCPKCGVMICKISGCDQMFCTHCNTAFNWRTGTISSGPVHNPHYFEWLRSRGQAPTNAGAGIPQHCDADLDARITNALYPSNPYYMNGLNAYTRYRSNMCNEKNPETRYLIEAWRIMREIEASRQREPNLDEKYRQLRVRYMCDELTEEEWKVALQRHEKDVHFQRALQQVREVFVNASRDILRQVLEREHDKKAIRTQVEELVAYCNGSFQEIKKRFGRVVPNITIKVPAT